MAKWKVYISSTFRDLKEFRSDLINLFQNQLKNSFELSEIMERMFDDGTYTPFADDCIQAVLESDIYIIILGNKTGSFPPNEDRTYTEIEFDTALANNKRIFCLRLNEFDEDKIDNKDKHDELLSKFKGRPIHSFHDITDLKNALYEFLIQFSSLSPVNEKNPYKGLASFKPEDGAYFFGRDAELESCLKKIVTADGNFFVSVIGNSGTGKSSFVQAGLMHRLKEKKEYGLSERLQCIVIPGDEPFTNLSYQLRLLGLSVKDILNPEIESPDLILYFDQFEEVITQSNAPESRAEVAQLFEFLDALADPQYKGSKVLVLCSFRSDFLSQLANFDFIKSKQYLFPISSLDYKVHVTNWEDSMAEIITKPALKNGVVIEKELVDQILNQLKEVEGSLPILQFTLEQIWNKETIEDRRISSTEYSKLSEGKGIGGIIQIHAEKVIKNISRDGEDKEKEAILKSIFVNLVEVSENLNDVKRTVDKEELFGILKTHPAALVEEVFETLVSEKSRLLNLSHDKEEGIKVGIIHEELIRKWGRLRGWIDERREALEVKKRIALDVVAHSKGEEGLYGRSQLKRSQRWSQRNPDLVNEEIQTFLQTSRKRNTRRLIQQTGIPVLLVALITTVILVWVQPAIQKQDFLRYSKVNLEKIHKEINASGGLDFMEVLSIDDDNYKNLNLNGNLKFFRNLKNIKIDYVEALKDLSIFKNMKDPSGLTSLTITGNPQLTDLNGVEGLKGLTSLVIDDNTNLTALKGIENLKALTNLKISNNYALTDLKGIEGLKALTSLEISDIAELTDLKGIESLKALTSLEISHNDSLTSLKGIENLKALTYLAIWGNESLTSLKGIENLKALTHLDISGTYALTGLKEIENLKALTSLIIDGDLALTYSKEIENLKTLTYLKISHDGALTDLKSFENLKVLTTLYISGHHPLTDLNGIELKALDSLVISQNDSLTNLKGMEGLKGLNSLVISQNDSLTNLRGIEKLQTLTDLVIDRNYELKDLEGIEGLEALTSLSINANYELKDLEGIEGLEALTYLSINNNNSLTDLKGIENLKALTSLKIHNNNSLTDLNEIENLKALDSLSIHNNNSLTDLKGIEKLERLTSLIISRSWKQADLEGLENLKALTSLKILDNIKLTDLKGIEKLQTLTDLVISTNRNLKSLNGVKSLEALIFLKIDGNDSLTDLKEIENLKALDSLVISNNDALTDLKGIEGLEALTSLDIYNNPTLTDLKGLEKLTNLKVLTIDLKHIVDYELLRKNNPGLRIKYFEEEY